MKTKTRCIPKGAHTCRVHFPRDCPSDVNFWKGFQSDLIIVSFMDSDIW